MPAPEMQNQARSHGSVLRFPLPDRDVLESELNREPFGRGTDAWLPNLSIDDDHAERVARSNLRAGVIVHLGVLAMGHALDAVERSLSGRAPRAWTEGSRLKVCFNVADDTDHAWIKVVDEGWALADAFGGDDADLLAYHIGEVDAVSARRK